MRFEFI